MNDLLPGNSYVVAYLVFTRLFNVFKQLEGDLGKSIWSFAFVVYYYGSVDLLYLSFDNWI